MSTPLIALASILAVFALVLIPLMMMKSGTEEANPQQGQQGKQSGRTHKKKKRR